MLISGTFPYIICFLQPVHGNAIVVIQPGSLNLRLGRAADTFPHSIPHCIARRHKQPGKQNQYEDPYLLRPKDEVRIILILYL